MNEKKEKEIVYTGINKLFRNDNIQIMWNSLRDGTFREFLDDWKWIFSYSKKYRWIVVFYTVIGIVSSTMSIGTAYVSRVLINIIVGQQQEKLWLLVSVMIGMLLLALALSSLNSYINARISIYVNNDIQSGIFDRIMDARWKELSSYPSGDLLNRFNSDVSTVSKNAISWLPSIVIALYNFVVTFVTNLIVYCIAMIYLACYQIYMISALDFFVVFLPPLSFISASPF